MRLILFLLLFLWICDKVCGSERFRQITVNEGLAHSDANCIVQDSLGIIWIGTSAGLQSYDGYALQTYDYYPAGNRYYQSHNRIQSMVCTGRRLWISTDSGLTCFDLDQCRYKPYYWKEETDSHLSKQFISDLYASPSGRFLWMKSKKGLNVFRIENDTLFSVKGNDSERLEDIQDILFQGENVWVATSHKIYQLRTLEDDIELKRTYNLRELSHTDDDILCDIYHKDRFLFIRTLRGCYRVPIEEDALVIPAANCVEFHAINSKIPLHTSGRIVATQDGELWCAYQEGVFKVEYAFSEVPVVHEYLHNTRDEKRSAQKIKDMLIDRFNNLWIATGSWGVYYCTLAQPLFKNLTRDDFEPMGFTQNEIVSITSREDGIIYMIVEYANLLSYDTNNERLTHITLPADVFQELYLQCIRMSFDQRHLYVGTNRGVFIYDTENQSAHKLLPNKSSHTHLAIASIADLQEDSEGRLWIGTWGDGLFCVEQPLTSPILSLNLTNHTQPALASSAVTSLFLHGESVFVCTTNGINRLFLTPEGTIRNLSLYQMDRELGDASLSSNYIAGIDCVNDSVYWLGTIGGGVNRIVLHSKKNNDYSATCYTSSDGLSSNDCEIVMTDHFGNVWVGGNGINQLNKENKRIYTYDYADGLQNNAFKINSSHKMQNGTLIFGGLYGVSYFNPAAFVETKKQYPLVFTQLQINNQRIIPGESYNGRTVLEEVLEKTSKLTLNHLQNNFSLSFAALGYQISGQLMYRYRLDEKDPWHELRYTENSVYFSNLPYGTYQLEIQLSTDMGNSWQTPGKRLAISILAPWWMSGWAKLSYALIAVAIAVAAFRQYDKEQKLKRENEIQKILIAQDEEKYQAKMRFFMNASHELKTPLTLVLLATEKLIGKNQPNKEFNTILYNIKRMLALIAELVDIRKQDLGISSLNLERVNMSRLIERMYADMNAWAENRHITMTCQAGNNDIEMDGDRDKLGKMILNLISNAIKYTDEGGKIEIVCLKGTAQDLTPFYTTSYTEGKLPDEDKQLCILKVKDTGVGISSESIRMIYERFFQVDGKTQSHLGSGIGLAIVKNVALQHEGVIIVSSERYQGSEFIVALPIREECEQLETNQQAEMNVTEFIQEQYNEFDLSETNNQETAQGANETGDRPDQPTLLIVEDNRELQMVLKEQFSASYNVHIAENGRVGLEKCMALFPDAIVSDVMMPEMDGIEMCKRIKDNLSIASIPIVLLTAKDTVENQIEGYESGADLYISKPFSMKLLEVNLRRLIAQREQWLKKNGKTRSDSDTNISDDQTPESQTTNAQAETAPDVRNQEQIKMTERLKGIIQEHMGNSELSPEFLAKELGVSRTKLYRDMKRIDGYSLADYLRNVRLEKAAYLLKHSDMNVQEVMFEVGFINSSHFTKVFKMKYGVPPTDYKRSQ